MSELLTLIQEWPVIVQGALGSALFALILYLMQKLFSVVSHFVSSLSRNSRISELTNERLKIGMSVSKGRDKTLFAAPVLYRMSRPFLKALIWLVLGLLFSEIDYVFGIVGYLGSIYYLVIALNIVGPFVFEGDYKARRKEIDEEIKKLREST